MIESRQEADSSESSIFLQDGLGILARIIAREIVLNHHPESENHVDPETDITQKQ